MSTRKLPLNAQGEILLRHDERQHRMGSPLQAIGEVEG